MQIDVRSDAQIIKKQHALRARTIVVEELAKACTATSCKTRKCQVFRGTQLHRRLWQSWNKEELFKHPQYCCLFSPSEKLLQSESVHAYSVNSPPPTHEKKEKYSSWIIWTMLWTIRLLLQQKKERLQAWNRTNNWPVETANLVSVQLKNAASICMTNGTFVQGREGWAEAARAWGGGGRRHTNWEGRCHAAIDQPSTLQHSAQHSTTQHSAQ